VSVDLIDSIEFIYV